MSGGAAVQIKMVVESRRELASGPSADLNISSTYLKGRSEVSPE